MSVPRKWSKPLVAVAIVAAGGVGYAINSFERDKAQRNADMYAAMARSAEASALAAQAGTSLAPASAATPATPTVKYRLPGADSMASVAAPQAAAGSALPDGTYACTTWIFGAGGGHMIVLGYVEVRGGTYRGPSQTPSGPFQPLPIDSSGEISWSPNFSSLASAGATIGRSYVTGKPGAPAFKVDYRNASGSKESMDCVRE